MKNEREIEDLFIQKLKDLKYTYRSEIRNRDDLEKNFRDHFELLNRVHLSDLELS